MDLFYPILCQGDWISFALSAQEQKMILAQAFNKLLSIRVSLANCEVAFTIML